LDAKLENIHKPRSSGASHKVVGHLLTEAGYTLWYWGYKNPYMAEYEPRNAVVENMGEVVSFSARRGKQPWLGGCSSLPACPNPWAVILGVFFSQKSNESDFGTT
jgi:hypothetical protein